MLYYVAFRWSSREPAACAQAQHLLARFHSSSPDWHTAVRTNGLAVCVQREGSADVDRVYVLPDDQGVVLGRLFERSYADEADTSNVVPRDVVFDGARARQIVASGGGKLISEYWGRYVAFLHDPATDVTRVLRDPTGGLPCQRLTIGAVDIYFVRIQDCRRVAPLALSVNQHYLLGYLLFDSICVRETGLQEVETLLAGECMEHCASERRRAFLWNPLQLAQADAIEDPQEAARRVRCVTRACVHAWASCFDGILLDLSGGLDSSIVLACLADAPTRPKLLCRHNHVGGRDMDERSFARAAAERARVELVEQRMEATFKIAFSSSNLECVSPFPHFSDPEQSRAMSRFMAERQLTAHFSGDGGDEVFCRTNILPTAVDYAWRHPLSPRLLPLAVSDAVIARTSVWHVLRMVIRYGLRKRPWRLRGLASPAHLPLLNDSIKQQARNDDSLWHPLFRGPAQIAPDKFMHAYSLTLAAARGFVPRIGESRPPYITPLISQPLLELCLRIPAYVHAFDGQDRAIARQAFAPDLPLQIRRRKSKGSSTNFMGEVLAAQMDLARQLLPDGFLVRSGWLDPARLAAALAGRLTNSSSDALELATYLDVEMWARSWDRRRDDRAAA